MVAVPAAAVLRAGAVPVELEEGDRGRVAAKELLLRDVVEHRVNGRAVRLEDLDVQPAHLMVQMEEQDREVTSPERERRARRIEARDAGAETPIRGAGPQLEQGRQPAVGCGQDRQRLVIAEEPDVRNT